MQLQARKIIPKKQYLVEQILSEKNQNTDK